MIRISIVALCTTVVFGGCMRDETVTAYGAADRVWTLGLINDTRVDASLTIQFGEAGHVSGTGPCNRFSSRNVVPYPWFELDPIASTKRACDALAKEQEYFGLLQIMRQSEVVGDVLILRADTGEEMLFTTSD